MLEKVISVIAEQLCLKESELNKDTDLVKDLQADSLDLVEIIVELERVFEMEVDEEEIASLSTIGSIVEYIAKRK